MVQFSDSHSVMRMTWECEVLVKTEALLWCTAEPDAAFVVVGTQSQVSGFTNVLHTAKST